MRSREPENNPSSSLYRRNGTEKEKKKKKKRKREREKKLPSLYRVPVFPRWKITTTARRFRNGDNLEIDLRRCNSR